MGLLMLFIDGVGLGGRAGNPLVESGARALGFHADSPGNYNYRGGSLRAIDATLGIDGLPQSATGQTTIFTGVNAAAAIGRHLSGMPSAALRRLLQRQSIFISLKSAGLRVAFANAFTPAYFLHPIRRMSASSLHMLYAGLMPRWIWHIPAGKALFQDFGNASLIEAGFDVPSLLPEQAGHILAGMLGDFDFVLYEFFLTDAAAHGRIVRKPREVIADLDRMIVALLDEIDLNEHAVLLCSDHGNIEDATVRTHTRAPVPLIAWGNDSTSLLDGVDSITGIHAIIRRYLMPA